MKFAALGLIAATGLFAASCGKKSSSNDAAVDQTPAAQPAPAAPVVAPVTPAAPAAPAPILHSVAVNPVTPGVPANNAAFNAIGMAGFYFNGVLESAYPDQRDMLKCKSFALINEVKQRAALGYYCWYDRDNLPAFHKGDINVHVQVFGNIQSEANGTMTFAKTGGCETSIVDNTQLNAPFTFKSGYNPSLLMAIPNGPGNAPTMYKMAAPWGTAKQTSSLAVGCINRSTSAFTADNNMRSILADLSN